MKELKENLNFSFSGFLSHDNYDDYKFFVEYPCV